MARVTPVLKSLPTDSNLQLRRRLHPAAPARQQHRLQPSQPQAPQQPHMSPLSSTAKALAAAATAAHQHHWPTHLHPHRRRTHALATSLSAVSPASPASSPGPLVHSPLSFPTPMLTLERAIGGSFGSDEQLQSCGAFAAEVFPDLPIATTWGSLLKALKPRLPSANAALAVSPHQAQTKAVAAAAPPSRAVTVTTVAVNLRTMKEVEQRMRWATAGASADQQEDRPGAGALLFVSGSHPVRSIPGVNRLLPSSIAALRLAADLRARGQLPATTSFWAVANPNLEPDAALLEAKVQAGAQVILTQPPFDFAMFQRWMQDAQARGLPSCAKILVGMPCISSPSNLAFWFSLAGCVGRPAATQLLARFQQAAGGGKEALAAYCRQYNEDLYHSLLGTDGVSGLHVMPITPASRRIALSLVTSVPGGGGTRQ